jgi:hypothetical protein
MIYTWQRTDTGEIVDVERKLADYKVPPDTVHDWVRVISVSSTPFQHLRHAGVFADDNGNFAPWSRNM